MLKRLWLIYLMALSGVAVWGQDKPFYLKNGDRVVFYGDSITDQRRYTQIVETYVVTRYPNLNVSFINSGWGGDTVEGGGGGPIDERLKRDVIAYKPTVLTIMLGMNDGGYRAATVSSDEKFFAGYRHIVDTTRSALPGLRITAIEPSPYDEVTSAAQVMIDHGISYNEVLRGYGKWIDNYAIETGLNFADLNSGLVRMLVKASQLDPEGAKKIIPDHVHPEFGGSMIMAEDLLKAWGAQSVVASVEIDASTSAPRVKATTGATVSDLSAGQGLKWTELDSALPLPFPEWQAMWYGGTPVRLAIQSSDIAGALNEELLKVKGLKKGVYSLKIDGESLSVFNDDELRNGVNLSLISTPMTRQAMQVYDLTVAHGDIHYAKWRYVGTSLSEYSFTQVPQAAEILDSLENSVVEKQHEMAKPKPHTFELVPIS
jgi:lysophospholipase L1-like esterase